ncbi:MAG: hypothetical protein HYU97_05840 [Deltaproteobacteria bacterium]|nr:hypothetical protein [Deltaproteobacteria bacterium]
MWIQNVMNEALQRGEKIKNQIVQGVLSSKTLEELLSNEKVLRSVTKAFSTKQQLEKTLRTNLRKALKFIEIPSREDLRHMQTKISQLETEMDGIHRKIMTSKLRHESPVKAAKKKVSRVLKRTTKKTSLIKRSK